MSLILGKNHATREEVFNTVTPKGTNTWKPIPHKTLIEQVETALREHGYIIEETSFVLSQNNACMFAGWAITHESLTGKDARIVVGARNSNNQKFAAAICVGQKMMVCDNLQFSSDYVIGRKHTTNILVDLPRLVSGIIGNVLESFTSFEKRRAFYEQVEITEEKAAKALFDLAKASVIPSSLCFKAFQRFQDAATDAENIVPKVNAPIGATVEQIEELEEPRQGEVALKRLELAKVHGSQTLWTLQNAVTSVLRGSDSTKLANRTVNMIAILDAMAGYKEQVGEFVQDPGFSTNEQNADNTREGFED